MYLKKYILKYNMACHYCHSSDHNINDCPNIICRYCNEVGHPKWLCKNKNKKNDKNDKNNKPKKNNEKDISYYLKLKLKKWSEIIYL